MSGKVYEVDPLKCPKCGGQMRIISFIKKKDQMDVIEKILEHCKLWVEPVERAPPEKAAVIPFESVHVPIDEFLARRLSVDRTFSSSGFFHKFAELGYQQFCGTLCPQIGLMNTVHRPITVIFTFESSPVQKINVSIT